MNRTFRLASSVVLSIWIALALLALHEGCGGSLSGTDAGEAGKKDGSVDVTTSDARDASREAGSRGPRDARPDRDAEAGGRDAARDGVSDGSACLVDLSVQTTLDGGGTPMPLVPAFSPTTYDYYVRCAAGPNPVKVAMTACPGAESKLIAPVTSAIAPSQIVPLVVNENQAMVASASTPSASADYWVRCLPHDFPDIELTAHPEAGVPPPGYYLVGNFIAGGSSGAYAIVLNGDGVPVWYYENPGGGITNVDSMIAGAISFLEVGGSPVTVVQIDPLAPTLASPTGWPIDFHEMRVLADGNFLVISSPIQTHVDLSALRFPEIDGGTAPGSPDASIVACDLVEFDPTTGAPAWTWKATDHLDPAKVSIEPIPGGGRVDGGAFAPGIDAFHCNAVDEDPANHNLLVSGRQTNSVFYVDRKTGKVLWKMGGASETLDDAVYVTVADPFDGQHDARLQPGFSACGGQISLFDDETYGGGSARGVVYDVSLGSMDGGCDASGPPSATVAWQYQGMGASAAEGSHRISSDGSRVIGWGLHSNLVFTEVDDAGHDLLDLVSNAGPTTPLESYRAIKVPLTALNLDDMRATAGGP